MASLKVSVREAVRHIIYKSGGYGALTSMRVRRGGARSHLYGGDVRSRFQAIYDEGVWQHGDSATPGSGSGSSLEATLGFRQSLPDILHKVKAKTLLDVGCGDYSWMQHVALMQDYIGVDVVDSVIADNQASFGDDRHRFMALDAIADTLPDADVVLCREILFHLSLDDARALLRNVLSKPRRFLIVTSDRQTGFNSDIPTGDFRLLNMESRPFRFPTPDCVIDDSVVCPGRIIGVWSVDRLPDLN